MPVYEYRGLNKSGRSVKGSVEADNSKTARLKLKKDGIYVTDLKDKAKAARKAKSGRIALNRSVPVADLSTMTRQLATLIKANVPLVDALGAVADQVENQTLSDVLNDLKTTVNEGGTLHKGLAKYPRIFNITYTSMCEAGEMSGTLDVILIRLAEFTEAESELSSKVTSAMIYPILMLGFTLILLGVLSVGVIPKITEVFESFPEIKMEWYTLGVIAFSDFMVEYWYVVVIGLVAGFLIFQSWKRTPEGKSQWDAIFLKIPVVGKLGRLIAVSRFTRTLATLLNGGVPMLTALGIVRNVVNNEVLGRAIDDGRMNISEGESIAGPLKKSGQFPPLVIHMISIGEKTGELENMLIQVADAYDFQVSTQIEGLTALLEPIMIVVMGCVIGFIVFAIMLPLFELSGAGV